MSSKLTAKEVLAEFKKIGITHVVCNPGTELKFIYDALAEQQDIVQVPVCNEGETEGIAAGLILGGKIPVVMHQNTGLFNSVDTIRGLGLEYKLPLLLIIGYKGWHRTAPIVDSAAVFTEPVLEALGIKHYLLETAEDAGQISKAYAETTGTGKPVAILIGRE